MVFSPYIDFNVLYKTLDLFYLIHTKREKSNRNRFKRNGFYRVNVVKTVCGHSWIDNNFVCVQMIWTKLKLTSISALYGNTTFLFEKKRRTYRKKTRNAKIQQNAEKTQTVKVRCGTIRNKGGPVYFEYECYILLMGVVPRENKSFNITKASNKMSSFSQNKWLKEKAFNFYG